MPNPLAELQSRSQAAASTSGPASTIDKIVGTAGGDVNIPELQSTNLTVAHGNFTGGLQIPNWTVSTAYGVGNIVRRNNTIYLITANHTSQAVSNNFYIDWLTNGYLTPMSPAPGNITMLLNQGAVDGGSVLPLDGGLYSQATYPDLYQYLEYGFTPLSKTFSNTDVSNNGGFAYFNIPSHGFVNGDTVYITLGGSGGSWNTVSQRYFIYYSDANNFYLSIYAWANVTDGAPGRVVYNAADFLGTGNTILTTPWGKNSSGLFYVPDARGIYPRGAGTSGLLKLRDNGTFFTGKLKYDYDKSLDHTHYYNDNGVHNYHGGNGGDPTPNYYGNYTGGADRSRITGENHTEPASFGVNYYIRF